MITLESSKATFAINVPTNRKEINSDVLKTLTEHINLSKNYAVVALVHRVKLWDLAATANVQARNKDVPASVVVLLAKVNGELPGEVGDKVCISKTDLEMGLHISGISHISVDSVRTYIASDAALIKSVVDRTAFADTEYIYLLEFKIVGFNSIKAIIDAEASGVNDGPFVILNNEK